MGLEQRWYQDLQGMTRMLLPLAAVYCTVVRVRRWAYRRGWLSIRRVSVPVLVVGNVTLGGTGKTSLIPWLVEWLRQAQYRPGVVSRGYGAERGEWPRVVSLESDPGWVGDEPVLIARRAHCPVMVGPDRVAAAEALLRGYGPQERGHGPPLSSSMMHWV